MLNMRSFTDYHYSNAAKACFKLETPTTLIPSLLSPDTCFNACAGTIHFVKPSRSASLIRAAV